MKLYFDFGNSSEIEFAVNEILKETGHENTKAGIPVSFASVEKGVRVSGDASGITIAYSNRSALIRGLSLLFRYGKKGEAFDVYEVPTFDTLSPMVDVSRNAVMKLSKVKQLIRVIALMGFNAMQLYTEDTYEIEGEPYFGHLRGRYSAAELKELDAYAREFGMEMIPCIQTLAHLEGIFRWREYQGIRDCDNILNCNDEAIYELIDKMIKTQRKVFTSDKINLGMDEAHMLGRGRYKDQAGDVPAEQILRKHLDKVIEICAKYGFKPRIWSDMFFRIGTKTHDYYDLNASFSDEIRASVPEDLTLIYWDYYSQDKKRYDIMMKNHFKLSDRIAFAGGASNWYGVVPFNEYSLRAARVAMESARENGMREIYVTMWGDNGGTCSQFASLPTLVCYGENNWNGRTDEDNLSAAFEAATGCSFRSFTDFERIELVGDRSPYGVESTGPHRFMLFSDPLQGKYDFHAAKGSNEHFKHEMERLTAEKPADSQYGYLYDTLIALCDVLSVKSELGPQLKAAYDAGDRAELKRIASEVIPTAIDKLNVFHRALRTQWYEENKAFGFEVQDIRLGGLKARLEQAVLTVNDYLEGRIDEIEELAADRLMIDPYAGSNSYFSANWGSIVTANTLN